MPKSIQTPKGSFFLEKVRDQTMLEQIQALDNKILGPHQGISYELLKAIALQDGLIACKAGEKLVGAAMLALESIPPEIMLEKDTALLYGTMLLPEYRGIKLGRALAREQEKTALEHGKTRLLLSVRPENSRSIILRLQEGFEITTFRRDYFGKDPVKDARFIMEKNFKKNPDKKDFHEKEVIETVMLKTGEKADFPGREKMAKCIEEGYRVKKYLTDKHSCTARVVFSKPEGH